MSEKNTTPVLNFVKKNFYYLLIGISLIVIATVIAIILATNQNSLGQSGLTPNTPSESVIQNKPESIVHRTAFSALFARFNRFRPKI